MKLEIQSLIELHDHLPEKESTIVEVLRQIIKENLPPHCKEKISYNVPFFYGHKGICIVWPSSIPRGGIKEGVLLGFWYGFKLKDTDQYLNHGTNKKVFYKIYKSIDEVEEEPIVKLLKQAVALDNLHK